MDTQALHERLGKVYHQPVNVSSFTNKRLTINFRSPIDRLRQIVPSHFEIEEIRDTGMGLISMCVCDFWVTKFGPVPVPKMHTNEMLCRISVKVPKQGEMHRAYYTLRSDSSSRILGFLGGHFSHFRKAISQFKKRDDGAVYELNCTANDAICNGHFKGEMKSVSKDRPDTTAFANIEEATEFAFNLDGSCGYNFRSDLLSFQKIEYPKWDLYFCHEFEYEFALLDYLFKTYDLKAEFDCVLFMQKIPQVWGSSWMYKPDAPRIAQQIETKVGIA